MKMESTEISKRISYYGSGSQYSQLHPEVMLRAARICAEAVQWMKDEDRREVLKEAQKILGCGEKVGATDPE